MQGMDSNRRLLFAWSGLVLSTAFVVGGAYDVKASDEANAVAYWERKLPGAMPSSIRAMLTPLTSKQATQLLINSRFLPEYALTFCKAAHIKCVQDFPPSPKSILHQKEHKESSSQNLIPLYHSNDLAAKNLIPLYHSSNPSPKNLIPLYQTNDPSAENPIPSDQSNTPSAKNLIPLYQSNDLGAKNLIPLYQSNAQDIPSPKPLSIDILHQKEDKESSSQNLIPLYQSNDLPAKNLIPLYQSNNPSATNLIPLYQSNDPATKNLIPIDQSDDLATPVLIPPTVHEVRSAFREKQVLVAGKMIYIDLASDRRHDVDERAFLPRKLARLFPFDNEGSKIASMLNIPKGSLQQATIQACEALSNKDFLHAEVKACLTSLEDVIDFVSKVMGSSKPIKVYDSLSNASNVKFVGKIFTILNVESLKQDPDEPSISCHDLDFPFRVFYCHYVKKTKSFAVTLQAIDGSVHERIVNCHYDTSYWNPHHVAFKDLQTKPGVGEICHWLGITWMEEDGWLFLHAS